MTPYTRNGLIMIGFCAVLCGAVIVATEPLRRNREELERLYSYNQHRRTP